MANVQDLVKVRRRLVGGGGSRTNHETLSVHRIYREGDDSRYSGAGASGACEYAPCGMPSRIWWQALGTAATGVKHLGGIHAFLSILSRHFCSFAFSTVGGIADRVLRVTST